MDALGNICTIRGVYVGGKAMMEDMIRAVEVNDIHPVVDEKVFTLEQAREAYEYMVSATYCSALQGAFAVDANGLIGVVGSEALWKVDDQDQLRGL